ncbi:MAG: STAS domain-containing protein [Pseudomonadota bacterium]|nr:STAS domain-containing protein [Pseudomonadota bacterium]
MANTISLPESLTIHTIEASYNDINTSVSDLGDDIVLDAEAVENIDTSGLQSLLMIIQTAKNNQKNISWQNANDTLKDAATKIGLSEALLLD